MHTLVQKIKNLFPSDTRIAELTTSIALVFAAFLCYFGVEGTALISQSELLIWVSALLGALQLISLVILDKIKLLRVYTSLLVGGLFIYMGSIEALSASGIQSCTTYLALGIANVYAFLVNNQRS